MITFKKSKDPNNKYDNAEIVYTTTSLCVTELLEDYKNFLLACGYPLSWNDEIVLAKNTLNDEEE